MSEYRSSKPLTTVGAKRLLKLAAFLRSMPLAKFDFSTIMNIGAKEPMEALKAGEHRCGTVGCAIGWMPAVWPKLLTWNTEVEVTSKETNSHNFQAVQEFFGIDDQDSTWLFAPHGSVFGDEGTIVTNTVGDNATPKQVAKHIERFVKTNYHGTAKLDFA